MVNKGDTYQQIMDTSGTGSATVGCWQKQANSCTPLLK